MTDITTTNEWLILGGWLFIAQGVGLCAYWLGRGLMHLLHRKAVRALPIGNRAFPIAKVIPTIDADRLRPEAVNTYETGGLVRTFDGTLVGVCPVCRSGLRFILSDFNSDGESTDKGSNDQSKCNR